jgi:hypothetical protein
MVGGLCFALVYEAALPESFRHSLFLFEHEEKNCFLLQR